MIVVDRNDREPHYNRLLNTIIYWDFDHLNPTTIICVVNYGVIETLIYKIIVIFAN